MRTGDLAGAEDALAEAFASAVESWPRDGAPDNPDGWLWTAARRRLVDAARRRKTAQEKEALLALAMSADPEMESTNFPDERLRLLFVCAHPAIDVLVRTPLMLQVVLGLDAARIAACLRVAPKTMGQRLWRAKSKIRDARIPFDVDAAELPERVFAVLEAIYAAYGSGWEDVTGDAVAARGLTEEAIWLARLIVGLLARGSRGQRALGDHAATPNRASPRVAHRTAATARSRRRTRRVGIERV